MLDYKISPEDGEFITALLDRYYALMLSAAKRCGFPGEEDEILAETALRLLKYVHKLKEIEPKQQSVYIYKVTQHSAYKHSAKLRRSRPAMLEQEPSEDELAEKTERRAALQNALGRLTPRERDILLFHHWGFTIREIAELMGLKPGSTGVYLQRAKARARKALDEWGKEGGRG